MKKRFQPQRRMNPALYMMSEESKNAKLIQAANSANLLLTMMVLRDEFGFGAKKSSSVRE